MQQSGVLSMNNRETRFSLLPCVDKPPCQEGFLSPQLDTGTIIAITVSATVVIACIAAAFFTGGQSLWGLALLA